MNRYVLGVAFDLEKNLVLIEKKRPDWQAGFYNFPGGKIEDGETEVDAISREFNEETGVSIPIELWVPVGYMTREGDFTCHIFLTIHEDVAKAVTSTDERVEMVSLDRFEIDSELKSKCISNLHTIVEFIMSEDFFLHDAQFLVSYPPHEDNL